MTGHLTGRTGPALTESAAALARRVSPGPIPAALTASSVALVG